MHSMKTLGAPQVASERRMMLVLTDTTVPLSLTPSADPYRDAFRETLGVPQVASERRMMLVLTDTTVPFSLTPSVYPHHDAFSEDFGGATCGQ